MASQLNTVYGQSPTKSIAQKLVNILGQPDLLSQFPSQSFETIWYFFLDFLPESGLGWNRLWAQNFGLASSSRTLLASGK